MANGAVQVICVFLSIIAFALTFIACCLPYWRSNDIEGEVIETIRRSSGLWTKCTYIRYKKDLKNSNYFLVPVTGTVTPMIVSLLGCPPPYK